MAALVETPRRAIDRIRDDITAFAAEARVRHVVVVNASYPIGHTIVKGVDIFDGHLSVSSLDVSVPARGMPLEFSRSYTSAGSSSSEIGRAHV